HLAAPGHAGALGGDDAGDPDRLRRRSESLDRRAGEAADFAGVTREKVPGEEEAERALFLEQALALGPGGTGDPLRRARPAGTIAEQAHLVGLCLGEICRVDRASHVGEQLRAIGVDAVEGAGAHERLDAAPPDEATVDTGAEVEQAGEGPGLARAQDFEDGRFTRSLDRAEP